MDNGPERDAGWSGPRPLVRGIPVIVGAFLVGITLLALVFVLMRSPDLPSRVSAHYVDMMAGSLSPALETADPAVLAVGLAREGLAPRVASLAPDFTLLGGVVHQLEERPVAAWFYRNAQSDMVLVEAFPGSLDALGEPDEVRGDRVPTLHVFRKMNQTLVFWQEGRLVYALITTAPSERVIALARRLAPPRAGA
jgi:hypothetical protein